MKHNTLPECFANQAESMLYGEPADDCIECEWFDKCHKITVAATLQSISSALDLIVENGLSDGRLKGFEELERMADAAKGRK